MDLDEDIYTVRPGTIDYGREFESKLETLFSLRCVYDDTKDFSFGTNVDGFGHFSDIVVQVKTQTNEIITYAIGIKHYASKKIISKKDFLQKKGTFSLKSILPEITNFKNSTSTNLKHLTTFENVYFILYTNGDVKKCDFLKNTHYQGFSFLNTSPFNDSTYKFDFSKLPFKDTGDFSNFRLFYKQSILDEVDKLISKEIEKMFDYFGIKHCNIHTLTMQYMYFIERWLSGELGTHYYLTKQDVIRKLSELCFLYFRINLQNEHCLYCGFEDYKTKIWHEIVVDKTITVVDFDEAVLKFLKVWIGREVGKYIKNPDKMWNYELSYEEQSFFYHESENLKMQMLKLLGKRGRMTLLDIYKCLWLENKLSYLLEINRLEEYESIIGILKLSNYELRVVVINNTKSELPCLEVSPTSFISLSDLNSEGIAEILTQSTNLQGRPVVLQNVIDKSMYENIKTIDIIRILLNSFGIGNQYEDLPKYFIPRKLSKVVVKSEVLKEIKEEIFVVETISSFDLNFCSEQKDNNVHFVCTENEASEHFEKFKSTNKAVHRLILHEDSYLEWKESFGDMQNIREYQLTEEETNFYWVKHTEDIIQRIHQNTLHVINANPGMGKSTLLKFLAISAPSSMWVLKINLKDFEKYYENIKNGSLKVKALDHLKFFNDSIFQKYDCTNIPLSENIFDKLANKKEVLVLLDGFEEIPLFYKEEVVKIAKCLQGEGHRIWLTVNPDMKEHLEEKFNTISCTLKPFTEPDRANFLYKYFTPDKNAIVLNSEKGPAIIKEFVERLLASTKVNLKNEYCKFTEIPFHMKILAQVFNGDCKNSIGAGVITLNDKFDVLDIYEKFLHNKNEILFGKLRKCTKGMRDFFQERQQLLALRLLFGDYYLQVLNKIRQLNESYHDGQNKIEFSLKYGVLLGEESDCEFKPLKMHSIIAEYLTAKWLSGNFNSKDVKIRKTIQMLIRQRFKNRCSVLFKIFDKTISKNCNLHLDVIGGQVSEAKEKIKTNPAIIKQTDAGGRTILHILALYGTYHADSNKNLGVAEDKLLDIFEVISDNKLNRIANIKDNLLGYTALDYAILNRSFAVANKICEKSDYLSINLDINTNEKNSYFKYCSKLKYQHLFEILFKYFASKELLLRSISTETSLESFCTIPDLGLNEKEIQENLFKIVKQVDVTTLLELFQLRNSSTDYLYEDLRFASAFGNDYNVKLLLSQGDDINELDIFKNTPLHYAFINERLDIITALFYSKEICNLDYEDHRILHYACEKDYDEIVKLLLAQDVDINAQDSNGCAPLHIAFKCGHTNIAKLLILKGANTSILDDEGNTPEFYEDYNVRSGTIDFGKEYEAKIVALLSLRCVLQKNMWIASNLADVGAFDDIILNMEMVDNRRITYMVQTKHKERPDNVTEREFLRKENSGFFLQSYFKDIADLKVSIETNNIKLKNLGSFDDIYFVLFTNRDINQYDFLDEDQDNTLSILDTNEDGSGGGGKAYKCIPKELQKKGEFSNVVSYLDNFRLLPQQVHVQKLDELIEMEMRKLVEHYELMQINLRSVCEKYVNYVTDWAKGKFGCHYYLTKREVLCKLTELSLADYEINLENEYLDFCHSSIMWNGIMEEKIITVVNSDDTVSKFLKKYLSTEIRRYLNLNKSETKWSSYLSEEVKDSFFKKHKKHLRQLFKIVATRKNIMIIDIYKCLWFNNKLPLLLQVNDSEAFEKVMKILNLSGTNLKVIIEIKSTLNLLSVGSPTCFVSLQDLNDGIREKILNRRVELQGRTRVVLWKLIDVTAYQYIKCSDIIHILSDSFNIGYEYESVLEYFIHRSLSKVFIKPEALKAINDEFFVIREENKANWAVPTCSLQDFNFSDKNCNIITVPEEKSLKELEMLASRQETVHRLTFLNEDCLEWKESIGSTRNVRKYQLINEQNVHNFKLKSDLFWVHLDDSVEEDEVNVTRIISGSPGMGKSTLLDFIVRKAPVDTWVLKIILSEHQDYYDTMEKQILKAKVNLKASDHLNYFNEAIYKKYKSSNTKLFQAVFNKLKKEKKVLVFLDGFDEISIDNKDKVTKIAKCLHDEGYQMWITTRPVMKSHLEEVLNTISITLKPFSKEDQRQFLIKYFTHMYFSGEIQNPTRIIKKFVEKLLRAASINLTDKDCEFTGVPLQARLLADAFQGDYKTSMETGHITLNDKFDLLYLYKEFIQEKSKILCEKFGRDAKSMRVFLEMQQQLFALQKLFNEEDLQDLDIKAQLNEYYENTSNKMQLMQQDGLTVAYEYCTETKQQFDVIFIHRTVAEYLAAKWLSKNFNSNDEKVMKTARNLIKKRFEQHYSFLFNIFDRLVAEESLLHLAVINGNQEETEKEINFTAENLNQLDAAGRTLLHLTALYGVYHPESYRNFTNVKDEMIKIITKIPDEKILNNDCALGYSPLDYAIANRSLAVANKICEKLKTMDVNIKIKIKTSEKEGYFTYCVILKYKFLFKVLLKYFAGQELLLERIYKNTTIDHFCEVEEPRHTKILKNFASELKLITILQLFQVRITDIDASVDYYYEDLRFAVAFGTEENVRSLLSGKGTTKVIEEDLYNNSALYYAVMFNRLKIVEILVGHGAEINKPLKNGRTILHCAVENDYREIIKELLRKGANINKQDDKGYTSLHLALTCGHVGVAKLLLAYNANKTLRDSEGNTVLHLAAERGYSEILQALLYQFNAGTLNKETYVNVQNKFKETSLDRAVKNAVICDNDDVKRQKTIVRILLSNGAQVDGKDENENTALTYARINVSKGGIWNENEVNVESLKDFYKSVVEMITKRGHKY